MNDFLLSNWTIQKLWSPWPPEILFQLLIATLERVLLERIQPLLGLGHISLVGQRAFILNGFPLKKGGEPFHMKAIIGSKLIILTHLYAVFFSQLLFVATYM